MARRGTSNTNARGSSYSRAVRRQWMLDTFGDGLVAMCSTCTTLLDSTSITADRWPIPGCEGGTYRRGNIRPQCSPCASYQGGQMAAARKHSTGRK